MPLIDRLLRWFAVLVAPAGIVVYCVAVATSNVPAADTARSVVDFRVVEDTNSSLTPRLAVERLASMSAVSSATTALSTRPFWFEFAARPDGSGEPIEVELPSRHARETTCWDIATLDSLGFANRLGSAGKVRLAKAGFAVDVGERQTVVKILCRATFVGPAHISVAQWPRLQFERSLQDFHLNAGLMEGMLGILVVFLLLEALTERDSTYLVGAAWVFATLRLSEITFGVDFNSLGLLMSPNWESALRPYPAAFVYILSVALLSRLFKKGLRRTWEFILLATLEWLGILLLVGAALLPNVIRLPFQWLAAAFAIFGISILLIRSYAVRGSVVGIAFSAALGISVLSYFHDTVVVPPGFEPALFLFSPPQSALLASVLMVLSIAEHFREERRRRILPRESVYQSCDAMPLGLFMLGPTGKFLYMNRALEEMLATKTSSAQHWQDHFGAEGWDMLHDAVARGGYAEISLRSPQEGAEANESFAIAAVATPDGIAGTITNSASPSSNPMEPSPFGAFAAHLADPGVIP